MSALPLDFDGSLDPTGLPEVTLGNHSLLAAYDPHTMSRSNTGRISPIRGRTMKEYDQQISDLKKENFSLKMRIYYMEERMQQRYGDGQDIFKTNIELQVEIENLKRDLMDKQVLVQKAAVAMKTLSDNHEQAVETMKNRVLVEHQDEMNQLREQTETATKECEKFKREFEESSKKIVSLKKTLEDALFDLTSANKSKEELINKMKSAEFDVQTLTAQLKLLEQTRSDQEKERSMLIQRQKDLELQISDARKENHRKDRDLLDELDDQKEALQHKDTKIQEMDDLLKHKDHVIEKLETTLKLLKSEKMVAEKTAEDKATELENNIQVLGKYKRSVEGLVRSLRAKDKEAKMYQDRLEESQLELEKLRESLRKSELERTEAAAGASETEGTNKRLEVQLSEANAMSENLIKSLGKKEGELAGFQDQLKKAMEALNKSEEALEALQSQLKAERADFENQLREQALKYQIALGNKVEPKNEIDYLRKQVEDLQSLIATQNSELLAFSKDKIEMADLRNRLTNRDQEIKMMSDEHNKELFTLTKELEALKAENQNKEQTIQTPATCVMWDNPHYHETINTHQIYGTDAFTRSDISGDPVELLQEIRSVIELLKREMSTLAHQNCNSDLRDSSLVDDRPLTKEVVNAQSVWQRMEDLLEKNNQLHLAVLAHMKRDSRQSDSPDSNSCQDGGYNLGSPVRQGVKSGSKSECLVSASASTSTLGSGPLSPELNHSVGVETSPDVLNKSQQTGLSFYHTDQWAQTSPCRENNHQAGESHRPISSSEKTDKSGYYASKGDDTSVRTEESLEDYHNFRHGISFDDYYFELCRQDRASAVLKSDSKARRSLPHSRSNKSQDHHHQAAQSLSPADTSPQSLGASGDGIHTEVTYGGDEPDGNGCLYESSLNTVLVFDQGEAPDKHTSHVNLAGGGDFSEPVEQLPIETHEKYYNFTRGLPNSSVQSERKQKGFRSEIDDLVDSTEDHNFDQRSRRNSWAEELEQYRVVGDQSELHNDQFVETVQDMSVRELRNLAIKLYSELRESEKFIEHHILPENTETSLPTPATQEIQALQTKLEATESTVRLLSKKNKQYLSALEAAGLHTKMMSRSDSESCLTNEPKSGRMSTASMENLSHRSSDQDNGHNERNVGQPHQDNSSNSPADHNINRVSDKEPYGESIKKSRSNNSYGERSSLNLISGSTVACTEAASLAPLMSFSNTHSSLTVDKAKTLSQNNGANLSTFKSDKTALQQNLDAAASAAKPGGTSPDHSASVELSLFDQSLIDFNYSSILDLTSLTRHSSMIKSLEGKSWKDLTGW
ncbi:hypothetical protein Btru_057992 [Bulinus truncatus]|nr:hypothetical protein Btru_057992 [Bulinus truncatus]